MIIILASGKTWYLKHFIWCFKVETFVIYKHFTFVTENKCKIVFFFNHHLKSAFSSMVVIKHQQKVVYDLYDYLKQNK